MQSKSDTESLSCKKSYMDDLLLTSRTTDVQKYLQRLASIEQNLLQQLEEKEKEKQHVIDAYNVIKKNAQKRTFSLGSRKTLKGSKYIFILVILCVMTGLLYFYTDAIGAFFVSKFHTMKEALFSAETNQYLEEYDWIILTIVLFALTSITGALTARDKGGHKTFIRMVLLPIIAGAFSYYCIGDMAAIIAQRVHFENWMLFSFFPWWSYPLLAVPNLFVLYFIMKMFKPTQELLDEMKSKIEYSRSAVELTKGVVGLLIISTVFVLCSIFVIDCTLMLLSIFLSNILSMAILINVLFFIFVFIYMRTQYYRMRALYKMTNKVM